MKNTWTFIGGMLAGIASVFATAAVAVAIEDKNVKEQCNNREKPLELPESSGLTTNEDRGTQS